MAAPGTTAGFHDAWERALGELEVDVARAEAILAQAHLPGTAVVAVERWRPPTGLGPLPASLERRARALLDRPLELARRTGEEIVRGRRQASALRAMRTGAAAVPVYVDVQG
jgi:hypothetical protein